MALRRNGVMPRDMSATVSNGFRQILVPPALGADAHAFTIDAWLQLGTAANRDVRGTPMLGGSQAGARIIVPLACNARLALTGSIAAGLARDRPVDLSFGLAIKPWRRVPLRLLVERRVAVRGRDQAGMIITLAGGIDGWRLTPKLRIDGYGEAGMIGGARTTGFADGALAIERQLNGARGLAVGLALRGAVQRDAARLDLAPMLVLRHDRLRLGAEWRSRFLGHAAPRSGPVLTIAAHF